MTRYPDLIIEEFRPLKRNTLRGVVRVRLASGLVIHDIAIHSQDGRAWGSPTGRPMLGKDGTQRRDTVGKLQFSPVVSFTDRAAADKFSDVIMAALWSSHPEALA